MTYLISLLINPPPLKAGGWFALESEPTGAAWTKHKQGTEFHILYLVSGSHLKTASSLCSSWNPSPSPRPAWACVAMRSPGFRCGKAELDSRPPPRPAPSSSHREEWLQQNNSYQSRSRSSMPPFQTRLAGSGRWQIQKNLVQMPPQPLWRQHRNRILSKWVSCHTFTRKRRERPLDMVFNIMEMEWDRMQKQTNKQINQHPL